MGARAIVFEGPEVTREATRKATDHQYPQMELGIGYGPSLLDSKLSLVIYLSRQHGRLRLESVVKIEDNNQWSSHSSLAWFLSFRIEPQFIAGFAAWRSLPQGAARREQRHQHPGKLRIGAPS